MILLGPYQLGYNDTRECGIYTGDICELEKEIPNESVDLIFTDPPYPKEYLYLWAILASMASRVLRPSGFLLTYIPTAHLAYIFDICRESLEFYWHLVVLEPGMNTQYHPKHAICGHKSLLLFRRKGTGALTPRYFPDGVSSLFRDKSHHIWGQSEFPAYLWTKYLAPETGNVLDPFAGGGTVPAVCKMLMRPFLAFEIDPETADRARTRVRNTQAPLFVVPGEQAQMELTERPRKENNPDAKQITPGH